MDGIKSNDMAAMVQVVEGGASCYAEVLDGNVTLNLAAYALFGHVAAIEWMVEKGADVTAANTGGCTALHFAAMSGHVTAMHCLVEHGADVKAANKDGATALHHAAQEGQLAAVKWLVGWGADIAARDDIGFTTLHFAARKGHVEVVKWLVEEGADVAAKDNSGCTALHHCVRKGHVSAAEYFTHRIMGKGVLIAQAATLHACTNPTLTPTATTEPIVSALWCVRDERARRLKKVRQLLALHDSTGTVRSEQLAEAKRTIASVLVKLPHDEETLALSHELEAEMMRIAEAACASLLAGEEQAQASVGHIRSNSGAGNKRSKRKHKKKGRTKGNRAKARAEPTDVQTQDEVGGASPEPEEQLTQDKVPASLQADEHAVVRLQQRIAQLEAENVLLRTVEIKNEQLSAKSSRLAEANASLQAAMDGTAVEIRGLVEENVSLVEEIAVLKQGPREGNCRQVDRGEKVLVELEELRAKFELLEQMSQPVQTENDQRMEIMSDTRKTALEISKTRQDLELPTKRMGELDSGHLHRLGLSIEQISVLQDVVCDPNFHPWAIRQIERGSEAVETVVNWENEQLQQTVQKYNGCSGGRGRQVAEELLRCNKDLQQWNPSGGYCVRIPYHHGQQRELKPDELLKIAVGIAVPGSQETRRTEQSWGKGAHCGDGGGGNGHERQRTERGLQAPCWGGGAGAGSALWSRCPFPQVGGPRPALPGTGGGGDTAF
jgi:hypothetical protein